jgi:hypothetical protein
MGKNRNEFVNPKTHMVIYTYPRRYYICMETRSINKGPVWQSTSSQYYHNHEEWDEDFDNDQIEQILPQYVETI